MSYFFDEIMSSFNNLCEEEQKLSYSIPSHFIISDNQNGIDFAKEIRVNVDFNIIVTGDDVDKLISHEAYITELLSPTFSMATVTSEPALKDAVITINLENISRDKMYDKDTYYSIIPATCKSILLKKRTENPIKVQLDKKTQTQIMMHLHILNLAYDNIEEHREEIKQQINEIFNFPKICTGTISISDDGFIKCYDLMLNKQCDITEATKLYNTERENARKKAEKERIRIEKERIEKERKKAEKERREKLTKDIYSKNGDTEMNRHTDPIVSEIQSKLDSSIRVYGGSTMSEFLLAQYENRLSYPCVVVRDDANFTFAYNSYLNITKSNNTAKHYFTKNDFPMEYSAVIILFANDKTKLKQVYDSLYELFNKETVISMPSLSFDNEYFDFKFVLPSTNVEFKPNAIEHNGGTIYSYEITCAKQPIIYHTYEITEDITNNQRLQFRMLQRMEFALLTENILSQDALDQINNAYSKLFEKETKTFMLVDLAFKALDRLIDSREYRIVKDCIINHKPINRDVFNKAFSTITKVYPELYDRTIQGWSIDSIRDEIKEKAKLYKSEWKQLYKMLAVQCPKIEKIFKYDETNQSIANKDSIGFFLDFMHKKFNVLLDDACEAYEQYLDKKAEQERREAEARRRELEEEAQREYYDDYYDEPTTGGFIRDTISFGIGSYLGTRGIRKEQQKQTALMREAAKAREEAKREKERSERRKRVFGKDW